MSSQSPSIVKVTPRKRKGLSDGTIAPSTPPSTLGKRKAAKLPTPNPPLAPFPTPPSSSRRNRPVFTSNEQDDYRVDLDLDDDVEASSSTILPPSLESLLTVHHAFNSSLTLHIAQQPPVLPPHSSGTTKLSLPNLTNFLTVRRGVEGASGKRFSQVELGRLAWLWVWDGTLPKEEAVDNSNPFLVDPPERSDSGLKSKDQVARLGYLVTATRTIDSRSGKKVPVSTYGIGIELDLVAGETRVPNLGRVDGATRKSRGHIEYADKIAEEVVMGAKEQAGGQGAIGRWTAGGQKRLEVVRSKLELWVKLHGGYDAEISTSPGRSHIPPIPILPLPQLSGSGSDSHSSLFKNVTRPSTSASSRPALPTGNEALGDPFLEIKTVEKAAAPSELHKSGSVGQRNQAMLDRIRARKQTQTLGSAVGQGAMDKIRPQMPSRIEREELKRKAMLSRLEPIAECIWMMFSAPSPGPSTLPTAPRGRRKAIPLSEMAEVVVKSSRTPLSTSEAEDSITMLNDICPFFLTVKKVGRTEWVQIVPSSLQTCPPSPTSSSLATFTKVAFPSPSSARKVAKSVKPPQSELASADDSASRQRPTTPPPRHLAKLPTTPSTPSPSASKVPQPPRTPTTPRTLGNVMLEDVAGNGLIGPSSPGRVTRYHGLREVRKRIRKELEK